MGSATDISPRMPDTPRRARAESGHTLLELLVVMIIMGVIMTLMTDAFRPLDQGTISLRDRAHAMNELRMAVDALTADLGTAVEIDVKRGRTLVITQMRSVLSLDARSLAQSVTQVRWELHEGDLMREDTSSPSPIVIARGLTLFEFSSALGRNTRITLGAGRDDAARKIHLLVPDLGA